MSTDNVVSFRPKALTRKEMRKSEILKKISESFQKIQREPIEIAARLPNKGRFYGAFNMPIYHLADGQIHHVAGEHIDLMRPARAYTRNAIELRCDALGLAIYVHGLAILDDDAFTSDENPVNRGIRIAVYTYRKDKPKIVEAFVDPRELYARLHETLLKVFNFVSREYNVAGITDDCLVLRSSHEHLFPDIPLGLADMENPT